MKLHLPAALRRALLALIALLSPAVVTTTLATATLAAITAPAMAEDLTITETKITEDITYNNVTVSSSSAHLYSTTENANFTAGTLTVDSNGKLVVGSTSFDGSSRFNFYATKFEIETGGSITFVENPQVYATDTLYALLVGVKQDDSIRVHNTHVYGAGHKDLTSEFLTSKIRHYMVQTNCYLTLTSGDLAINSSFEDDLLTFWVYVGDGNAKNGEAKATIADGVEIAHTDTSKKNRLYGLAIYRDGSLNVGKGNNALTLANCEIGGKMVSNRDIVFSNTDFRASNGDYKYSEADVTVNGKITFANTSSGTTIVYGSLTANGEIAIEGNNYIKLNSSTVLNLGGKIDNSGSLTLGGTINLNAANFTHSTASSFDDVAYNGYEVITTTYLGVITGTGTVAGSATWKVGGNTATYNAGDVTVTTTDKSTYRVSSGNVDLSTVLVSNDTNKILLCGGNLVVNTDISSLIPEITTVDGAASTVTINTSLNQNALTATDDKTITLCGTGSYVINGTDLSLGTGIMISDSEWSGTVKTTGATAVSGAVNTTGWNNTELNGTTTVNNGATLTLGGNTKLNGLLENNGSVVLGGTITVDSTAFTAGSRERYSAGDNGYKTIDTTYTVLTGAAATGSATWKVGTTRATYENGMVILSGNEDKTTYCVASGTVNYGQDITADTLDAATTMLSLEGGHLQLGESLADGLSLVAKAADSSVDMQDRATLKSSQISVEGAGSVKLSGSGVYEITSAELGLGSGVSLSGTDWNGTVKTTGATTVSSDVDTIDWKNTELNGATTVNSGASLTLGGNTTLGGKITNSGELNLSGNITILMDDFDGVVITINPHYQQGSSAESMTSGFMSSSDGITIQVVEGNSANATGANWSVTGVTDGSYTFDAASGELHVVTDKSSVGTKFYINDDITYVKEGSGSEIFTNINGDRASELVLNGGDLKLSTALHEETAQIKVKQEGAVEIGEDVNLNASQLAASDTAAVELSGKGTYTMANGANTLGEGVSLDTAANAWTGTVKVSGGADALKISTLGVSGSSIELGAGDYTLAAGNHTVNAKVNGEQSSLTMNGGALDLNDTTTLKGVYGASSITATDATISNGLTTDSISGTVSVTGGTLQEMTAGSAISTSGTVALEDVTLGSVLNNSSTLSFAGNMTLDTSLLGASPENENWYSDANGTDQSVDGWYGSTSGSGFRTIQDIYTVVTGQAADNQATWKVDDREAEYDDGKVLAFREKDLKTYWVNTNSEVILGTADDAFTGDTTTIALNGGKLVMDTHTELAMQSHATSTIEIGNDVTLNASQLDASAADVTLSGSGSYDLQGQELSGDVKLATGVALDENAWKGTVYTGSVARGAELDITALGNRQSTVYLGSQPVRRSTPSETVLESLTAGDVGTTETPDSLTLQNGTSTANALVVNGILTLGTTNTAASLEADSVSLQGLNFAHADSSLVTGKLEGPTTLNVQLTDEVLSNKDAGEMLTLVSLRDGFNGTLTFNGDAETERVRSEDNRKEYTLAWNEDGTVLTLTILGTETYVTEQVAPTTGNGRAAVELMTDVFLNSQPQKNDPEGDLADILNAVDAGTATDRDMAAVAGASTAALGMALSGDVERQLSAIRNRSISGAYGRDAVALNDGKVGAASMPESNRYFAWVNAEGNRAEQNADGTSAGYTLTSWGGTLGAGMLVNDQLTLGLALTAMYGDLQSDGPDYLKGDMDTTYMSAFARYESGKWSHAFIGTAGTMEADYKRTVSHAAGGYNTSGDTDGTAFGLMYEVSREFELGNRSTLSPVLNIAYRHTEVDSYSESGSDAALNVGKQSMDTVTLGAGARYAAVVGQQTLNRACAFEARALAKYDFGDTQTDTTVGFINHATRAGIKSAEMGAFGVELGAGISVPVGSGSIFADSAVELRSDYTNFNATVGYKIQF